MNWYEWSFRICIVTVVPLFNKILSIRLTVCQAMPQESGHNEYVQFHSLENIVYLQHCCLVVNYFSKPNKIHTSNKKYILILSWHNLGTVGVDWVAWSCNTLKRSWKSNKTKFNLHGHIKACNHCTNCKSCNFHFFFSKTLNKCLTAFNLLAFLNMSL